MRLLAAAWALYSLFSRVGAVDLLALQLACIAVSWAIGERLNRLTHAFGRGFSPDKVRIELYKINRTRRIGTVEALFVVGVALAFAYLAAAPDTAASLVASGAKSAAPAGPGAAGGSPHPARTAGAPAAGRSGMPGVSGASGTVGTVGASGTAMAGTDPAGRGSAAVATPGALPTTPDIRHCLSLGSAEAIVRCAETSE